MRLLSALAAGLLLAAIPALPQAVTATLLGNVTDSSGASVPGAAVVATEVNTGIARRVSTNQEGIYALPYLTPGSYRVDIEASGFKKFVRENLELRATTSVRVDATLEPGALSEVVEVKAESPLLQTDRSEVSRSFSQQAVVELPFANRSFQSLVGLMPGVTPPSVDFTTLEDPQGTTFFRANGQGNSANNTQVDGVDNTNPTLGLTIYIPSAEVVQEVNVTTSNYNAEFGRAGGAVLNVTTRGGTNHLHGSLFEFHRSTNLRARNFFNTTDQPKPTFIRNEFGGAIGGPIKRDKTFFFGAYQGRLLRQASTSTNTLPVDPWRRGDFSAVPGLFLFDPATGNKDGTARSPFAANQIPVSRFHPITNKLLPLLFGTNQPGLLNNFIVNVPFRYDGHSYDGRVDHNFSDYTKAFAKFNYSKYNVVSEAPLGNAIGNGSRSTPYTVTGILNLTHGFSPTLLTEVRAGYNRYYTNVNGINIERPFNQELGIRNPNPDPISSQGLASIQISGLPGIGAPVVYPLIHVDNLFNLLNNWNKTLGRHSLKWGVDVRRSRGDRFQPQGLNFGPRGRFDFNPGTTALRGGPGLGSFGSVANAWASFLLGVTDQTSRTYMPITPTNRQTQFLTFFHDTFQITPRLTLDLGLRHELYTTVKPRYAGGASNYDPDTNSLIVAGVGGIGLSTNVDADRNNFAPRFGLSYRLSGKAVLRTGYGVSYYTGRFGFTGGTLSTQFPVIYNIQEGVAGDFIVDGSFDTLPVVPILAIPSNGRISPAPNQAFFTVPSSNPIPFVHSYNLTYQRELGYGLAWDVGYVGSLGRRIPYQRNLNAAPPGAGSVGRPFNVLFGRTADVALRAHGLANNYNSLQTNLTRRFSGGLSFTAAYTYSKNMGTGDDQGGFIVQTDIRRNYGPTGYDRTHMFTASHIYQLPFGAGKKFAQTGPARYILGGWQLNGIFRRVTGAPFTVVADATPCNCPGNSNFADALRRTSILGGVGRGRLWFDTSAFTSPGPNRYGNTGRNGVRGPGFTNYDFSVFRTFPIHERTQLEFRAEAYNLSNTPRFGNPVNSVNSGSFGQILGASGEREVQFALRLTF
ncbi:MAG: TonB-dependent receptor [Candidatus Solibacter usitatus]|nr:TonB-dependent receptor [Candidatus Solibacter usitatus]